MQLLATDNRDDFVVYDSPLPDDYEDEDLPMDLEGVEGAYVDDLIWGKEAGCYVTLAPKEHTDNVLKEIFKI